MRLGAIILLAVALIIPAFVLAAEFRTGEQPSLSSDETVSDDLYMAGGNVSASGTVGGDLLATGGNVIVNGRTTGDVAAAGGSVSIIGNVEDDVRAAGGTILVQGRVGNDVVIGGGQVTIGGPGIGGDVFVGSGTLRLDAPVTGSVKVGGGEVYINAAVGGDLEVMADKVTLGPKASIAGNFTYTAPKEATLEEGASVRGETTYTESKRVGDIGLSAAGIAAIASLWFLGRFLMTFIAAFAVAFLLRRYSEDLVKTAAGQPLLEIGRGLVFFIVTPIVSVGLLFTIIGIPLGLLGILAFAAGTVFVSITAPIVLGSIVHKWIFKPAEYQVSWKTVFLGVALYFVLKIIPFIGWIGILTVILLTAGAMINLKWRAVQEWR